MSERLCAAPRKGGDDCHNIPNLEGISCTAFIAAPQLRASYYIPLRTCRHDAVPNLAPSMAPATISIIRNGCAAKTDFDRTAPVDYADGFSAASLTGRD